MYCVIDFLGLSCKTLSLMNKFLNSNEQIIWLDIISTFVINKCIKSLFLCHCFVIHLKVVNFHVASKCFNSVPLALYFMRIFPISWFSIFTIWENWNLRKILVSISYKFIFWGKCDYECVCMCLTMPESPQNSMKCHNCQKSAKLNFNFDHNWTQFDHISSHFDPSGP